MVADGTYQDTHCDAVAWSYGLFPNWRNTLWSCNWSDITGFQLTRWGVQTFGVPVAISNGWGDDCGPSEWSPHQRDAFLGLFRRALEDEDTQCAFSRTILRSWPRVLLTIRSRAIRFPSLRPAK